MDEGSAVFDQLKYASLFLHESAHAYGKLFDEYDIGITTTSAERISNCMGGRRKRFWAGSSRCFRPRFQSRRMC